MSSSSKAQRLLTLARVDFEPAPVQPAKGAVILATIVALGLSLGADVALVTAAEHLFPSTRNFTHFRVLDYGGLTTVGVLVACAAWPATTKITSSPRWFFLRLAILVTFVLFIPDLWILIGGEPPKAIAALVVMHVVIAFVTYNALVRIASVDRVRRRHLSVVPGTGGTAVSPVPSAARALAAEQYVEASEPGAVELQAATASPSLAERRSIWVILVSLAGAEFVLGIVALLFLPPSRPTAWIPHRGLAFYLLHTVVGLALVIGAVAIMPSARRGGRSTRISATIGLVGVILGALGGLAAVYHSVRILGMGLMLVGILLALMGYLMPSVGSDAEGSDTEKPELEHAGAQALGPPAGL